MKPKLKWRTSTSVPIGWEIVREDEVLGGVQRRPGCDWASDKTVPGSQNLRPELGWQGYIVKNFGTQPGSRWEGYVVKNFGTQEEAHEWVKEIVEKVHNCK